MSDNLLEDIPLNKLALRVDDDRRNLVIIPTGTRPPSPADFVASPAFAGLIGRLENEADLVVLDAPPILPVSDALSMARQVDAVIVVAKAGSTSRDQLAETLDALRAVGADVLGVCLVGVKSVPARYGYEDNEPRRSRRRGSTDLVVTTTPTDQEPAPAGPGSAPAASVAAATGAVARPSGAGRRRRGRRNRPAVEPEVHTGNDDGLGAETGTGAGSRSVTDQPDRSGPILDVRDRTSDRARPSNGSANLEDAERPADPEEPDQDRPARSNGSSILSSAATSGPIDGGPTGNRRD